MAKRRRSRFKAAPPRKKSSRDSSKEWPDSLPAPNHIVPLELPERLNDARTPASHRFPLLHLARSEDGGGQSTGLVFVDEIYGLVRWVDRDAEAPPTWMDPELFVRAVLNDELVSALMAKGNTKITRKALRKRLSELFESLYLPYLKEQFHDSSGLLARWMLAHAARGRVGRQKTKR